VLGGVAVGRGFEPQSDLELFSAKIIKSISYYLCLITLSNKDLVISDFVSTSCHQTNAIIIDSAYGLLTCTEQLYFVTMMRIVSLIYQMTTVRLSY
jgi:hypothetical protein